jgi:streptomycin 6-kinase
MNLPADFLHNIHTAFGVDGKQWLENLPSLLEEAAQKWELTLGEPLLLSYNYVCAAKRADGTDVVLKLGVPNRELKSELAALRLFNGDGACRLLEADDDRYMFLLERLKPGEMLTTLKDDEEATHIAADVMTHLWRKPPSDEGFIKLSEWFAALDGLRPRYAGGTGPFPKWLVERVESLLPELFADPNPPVLMHGDFHHFNVLSSERGWLAIDPKGVIGPAGYECGPLLMNPIPDFPYRPEAVRQTERRIAILSERLGFTREHIRDWGLCHCLLSGWWDLAEDDTGSEYTVGCAQVLAKANI